MAETWLPAAPACSGVRVEIGAITRSACGGSSPCSRRYSRSAPPTTVIATSLMVAPGTAALICLAVARSTCRASTTRCVVTTPLNRVLGAAEIAGSSKFRRARCSRLRFVAPDTADAVMRAIRIGLMAVLIAALDSSSNGVGARSGRQSVVGSGAGGSGARSLRALVISSRVTPSTAA